jgi:hypothetical protein
MRKPRDTTKYRLLQRGKLVPKHPYGITDRPLGGRGSELQQQFPGAKIQKVGIKTTRQGALQWERKQYQRRKGKS